MADTVHLQQLLASFQQQEKQEQAIQEAVRFLQRLQDRRDRASSSHRRLCTAMLQTEVYSRGLLQALGPAEAFIAAHSSIAEAPLQSARWLCSEVHHMISSDQLCQVLYEECRRDPSHGLTSWQEQLVGVVCRLPDLLANRMGHQLHHSLLPRKYFAALSRSVLVCLEKVHGALQACEDCALVFPAAVVGKAALLGHKDAVFSQLVPVLERRAAGDPLWKRMAQILFARVPTSCLEPVLDAVVHYVSPSLLPSGPLHLLLGELAMANQRAGFLLAHKLVLVKVPPSPHAAFTLVGYLASSEGLRGLLAQALQAALGVWADASVLRHMDTRQHQWIARLLVLGMACLSDSDLASLKPTFQRLIMAGLQVHIDCPVPTVRETGMAVGESIMNCLNPAQSEEQKLKFEYSSSEDIQALLQLARPVEEQEKELKAVCWTLPVTGHVEPPLAAEGVGPAPPKSLGVGHEATGGRYGQGMVQAAECSDIDSDDDLEPYAMGEDPDSSQPRPPRYLRTLLQALQSSSDPLQQETALRAAESLIRSQPVDLSEVCQELAKVLLHLSDALALPELPALRHKAMVALVVARPTALAQYLTTEFYSPHYSLRQRTDILEVLSASALELSDPLSQGLAEVGVAALRPSAPTPLRQWEEDVQERLKAKTRIIARGPHHSPHPPTASRFAPVAGHFFFPLLVGIEQATPSLDLLGRDCLLLGTLLHTLGVLMHAATHAPLAPRMAAVLLDFAWALRYHSSVCVRQGVLFALGMLLASVPPHSLLASMDGALVETGHWLRDVCVNDADGQCRSLASHALSLLDVTAKEVQSS